MTVKYRNPHQRAMVTLGGLVGFSLLLTLAIWGLAQVGLANPALGWIGTTFFVIFALIWWSIWLLGWLQARRARAFLESSRPLVRWTYSAAEWQQLKEVVWQEERSDWKVQWGCLALLLALTGLLTGILIGLEEGLAEVIVNGGVGFLLGGLAGSVIGALVAGGNYLGARQAYLHPEPGQVALAQDEIYAHPDYFKGNGRSSYIQSAKIQPGNPATLELELVFPPRPRMPSQEQWIIPLPASWLTRVEEVLPELTRGRLD